MASKSPKVTKFSHLNKKPPCGACRKVLDKLHERVTTCPVPQSVCGEKADAFDKFRPKRGTCLDYSISQTDAKYDAGNVQLHLRTTEAVYERLPEGVVVEEPAPPPKKRKSRGRGPVWVFADEIWRKKQELMQQFYRKNLKKIVAKRKKQRKKMHLGKHMKLLQMAGPDWYQELSPKQLKTIDQLEYCIVQDLKNGTTVNTQDNIASLGLVLRPNRRHIELALFNCCACPVEFLLVLYQLIDPNRTAYSINDRLLLSGVVHLTMKDTLKELHVRIPSPPPQKKPPKPRPKREGRTHYDSPYLEPYRFKPKPRKFTGIYEDKHRQYPDSEYFLYIDELKQEMMTESYTSDDSCSKSVEYGHFDYDTSETEHPEESYVQQLDYERAAKEDVDISVSAERDSKDSYLSQIEAEIIEEMHIAQKKYNALTNMKHAPKLYKPSIYIPCNFELPTKEDVEPSQPEQSNHDLNISIEVKVTTEYGNNKCECTIQINNDPKEDPIDCLCIDNVQTQIGTQAETGSVNSNSESQISENEGLSESIPKQDCEECRSDTSSNDAFNIELRKRAVEELQSMSKKYIIGGVVARPGEKPIFILNGVVPVKECACGKRRQEQLKEQQRLASMPKPLPSGPKNECRLVTVKETVPSECECRAEVQKMIETSVCRCDKCMDMRRMRQKALYIIASTRQNMEDEKMIPVIGGVKPQLSCRCLQNYEDFVKKYEELKLRKRALDELQSMSKRYIIGGVVARPGEKPIYILNGVIPVKECPCVKRRLEQLKEQQRLANMPKPLPSGMTCIISGVKETPEGNIYMISGVRPKKKCRCEVLYEQFEREHKQCMTLYDRYSQKIQKNMDEYMRDIRGDERYNQDAEDEVEQRNIRLESYVSAASPSVEQKSSKSEENLSKPAETREEIAESAKTKISEENKRICDRETCKWAKEIEQTTNEIAKIDSKSKENAPIDGGDDGSDGGVEIETNLDITVELKGNKTAGGKECVCAEPNKQLTINCPCGKESQSTKEEEPELKRFIILKKIPCQWEKQCEILKKALESLKNDQYPLAKLPEAYKLPHFRLWMQLRCGMYWTLKDKYMYVMENSKELWGHLELCHRRADLDLVNINISKAKARDMTWKQAKSIRKLVTEKADLFYRNLRQCGINDGREFFPSMYAYEFPTPTFRDCYFAYTPSKEEDVLALTPWQPYEIKDFRNRQSCICK